MPVWISDKWSDVDLPAASVPPGGVGAPGTVTKVPLPIAAREHVMLSEADYTDAFLVRVGSPRARTAEQWARLVVEEAPLAVRLALVAGWRNIGLKINPSSPPSTVCGWELRYNSADVAVLGADSHIGMPAELLFKREPTALLFATFVAHWSPVARITWSATEATHQLVVQQLLEQAAWRGRTDDRHCS